jgi:hypothetical protein
VEVLARDDPQLAPQPALELGCLPRLHLVECIPGKAQGQKEA